MPAFPPLLEKTWGAESGDARTARYIKFPTPRDLNDPEGWKSSNFRYTSQPALSDSFCDLINGVWIHGFETGVMVILQE